MLKISGVVVLYNPDNNLKRNIASYLGLIDKLYVVENTPNANHKKLLPKSNKIMYINNGENLGVATALNIGANQARIDGYHWMLTMDQDSIFKGDNLKKLVEWLNRNNKSDIGLISPWHKINIELKKPNLDVDYPIEVMTSGNIINLDAHEKIGGYKEWLFIDCVDFDYCFELQLHDYKIVRINTAELKHELGEITTEKFLGRRFVHSNHNRIRRYFIIRNTFYMKELYQHKFPEFIGRLMKGIRHDIINIILWEKDKYRKLRNMYRGYRDYKKGIKGGYPYNN